MRGRLALKRPAAGGASEEGSKRPAAEESQAGQVGRSWAADFAEELGAGIGSQQQELEQPALEPRAQAAAPSCSSDKACSPLPSPPGDEQARKGLLKVAESMRRRVDEGHLQLLVMQRLQQQKQQLLAAGEGVLEQAIAATWQQQQQQWQAGGPLGSWPAAPKQQRGQQQRQPGSVTVHSLEAECAAGQWWLQAVVGWQAAGRQQEPTSNSSGGASLLAVSSACSLVCRQQQCSAASGDSDGGSLLTSSGSKLEAAAVRLQLTAALDVQQHDQQQEEDAWADVFLLLGEAGQAAMGTADTPAAALPPMLLGRVQLSWQQWLESHACSGPSRLMPVQQLRQRLSRVIAVSSQQLDLRCLHQVAQQQLGCAPCTAAAAAMLDAALEAPYGSSSTSSSRQAVRQYYVLRQGTHQQPERQGTQGGGGRPAAAAGVAETAAAAAAAALCISQHSSCFAEVRLQASSTHMLNVMQQQVAEGLRQATAQAGLPPGDASVESSLLSPQHAQQQAAAADALVRELDASIDWVESLLKEKLALDSQHRRQKVAPNPAALRQRQAAALEAMAATDGSMVSLLRC